MLARVVDEELALGDAGGAEGVGLDDVRAGFEEAAMDVADHVGLGEGEEVAVVEQVFGRVLEALAADVGFLHAVGADGGAHRAIDDGDSILEDLLQRMLLCCLHLGLMILGIARSQMAEIPRPQPQCTFPIITMERMFLCAGAGLPARLSGWDTRALRFRQAYCIAIILRLEHWL